MLKLDAYKVYLTLEGVAALIFSVIFTVNMVYQVSVAQLTPLQLVLVGTMLETTIFLFEVPTGVVADVYSRRLSVIIGYLIIGLGFILEGSFPVFWTIMFGQVLWGLGYTFTSGATQAWISDEIGEEAASNAFIRGSQAGTVGALVGIVLSVLLGSIRVNIPIIVGGFMFLCLGGYLILVMPERGFKPTPSEERTSWGNMVATFRGGLHMINRRPILYTILFIGLFYGLYSEGYDRLWTKHLLDNFSLPVLYGLKPVAWFGIINAVGMLLSLGSTELVRRRIDTNSKGNITRLLMLVTGVLATSLVGLAWAMNFGLALILIWLIDMARSVIYPVYTGWVNQRIDSQVRATLLSMTSQVDAIGQITGGPFLGLIGNSVSVRAAITASGLILSPVLGLFARAARQRDVITEIASTSD
ncbi:MAG TPA: MFS transporter [Anaerolineales bacterium]|nr:MFS transporter [Anaerolineales bacterium]